MILKLQLELQDNGDVTDFDIPRYLFYTAEREDSIRHLRALYDGVAQNLEFRFTSQSDCRPAFSVGAEITLNALHEHANQVSTIVQADPSKLQITRQYHLEILLRTGKKLLGLAQDASLYLYDRSTYGMGHVLDALWGYSDLIRIHPDLGHENDSQ